MATLDETIDLDCVSDFSPRMPQVSGRLALVQRLARKLSTRKDPRRPFWPGWGFDVKSALLSKLPPDVIGAAAKAECEDDEQVESADVSVERIGGSSYSMSVRITDAEGTFEFTMTITEAATTLADKIREL